ncbi:invasion associated locus B family protein [Hoeflea sp.]|uniref:invasion associated locus B family protein n=1 Tax=Hoeflea sp. TaxID=1940281 RepID=UPI003BACCED0
MADEGPEEAGNCEATLRISNRGEQIAELAIGRMQGADDLIVAGRVPLGVRLREGLLLGSDPDNRISVPYSNCLPNGCVAHTVVTSSEISRLLSRGQTYLSFRERSGRTVRIAIPLDGLDRALGLLGIESGS